MKRSLAALLTAALVCLPSQTRSQPHKDMTVIEIACGTLVIGIGIYAVIELNKVCDKIPKPDLPPTNTVPIIPPVTNSVPTNSITNHVAMVLNDSAVQWWNCAASGQTDSSGAVVGACAQCQLVRADSPSGPFSPVCALTLWSSPAGLTVHCENLNSGSSVSGWLPSKGTLYLPLPVNNPSQSQGYFKLVSTP